MSVPIFIDYKIQRDRRYTFRKGIQDNRQEEQILNTYESNLFYLKTDKIFAS
jgi:hypothetical protein